MSRLMAKVRSAVSLFLILSSGLRANAGIADKLNPQGLLKAMLFPFEVKVEAIAGFPSCEDHLHNLIDNLGQKIAKGSSSPWLGSVAEDAYNDAMSTYRREQIEAVGLSFEEREKRLKELVPELASYKPARIETPDSRTVNYVNFLIEEYSKFEKVAYVNQTVRDLEYFFSGPAREVRPLEIYNLPGDRGRAYRLVFFFRDILPHVEHEYEPAFKIFADAFLTPEIIKESLGPQRIENTQEMFRWLHDHNRILYLHFLEKYQPFTQEEFLLEFNE